MTIGDVLAAVAALFALGATWTATLLLVTLAFPSRVGQAQDKMLAAPGATLLRGLGTVLLFAVIAGALGRHPAGPARLLSWLLWACLAALTALGSAGIARLVSERIQGVGTTMPPFASLTRGTIVYVVAGFLPVIGWFVVAPIALLLSVGSAVSTMRRGSRPVSMHPPYALSLGGEREDAQGLGI